MVIRPQAALNATSLAERSQHFKLGHKDIYTVLPHRGSMALLRAAEINLSSQIAEAIAFCPKAVLRDHFNVVPGIFMQEAAHQLGALLLVLGYEAGDLQTAAKHHPRVLLLESKISEIKMLPATGFRPTEFVCDVEWEKGAPQVRHKMTASVSTCNGAPLAQVEALGVLFYNDGSDTRPKRF
jgi:hypothetical protein